MPDEVAVTPPTTLTYYVWRCKVCGWAYPTTGLGQCARCGCKEYSSVPVTFWLTSA